MEQCLLSGGDLLVVAEPVPAGSGNDHDDRRVQEHRQGGAVLGAGSRTIARTAPHTLAAEPPVGFEPTTYALQVRCSGQLS